MIEWLNQFFYFQNLAHLEAYIDFSEDENIEDNVMDEVRKNLTQLNKDVQKHLADNRRGERLRDGVKAIIVGEPNAGKSSLLNLLCQRPAAIVTPIPGTTRDIIELHVNIDGYPLILTDTAGLRSETDDIVEKEGISRAHAAIKTSDLVILLIDAKKCVDYLKKSLSRPLIDDFLENHVFNLGLRDKLKYLDESKKSNVKWLYVFNKIDLLSEEVKIKLGKLFEDDGRVKCLSCTTEEGMTSFLSSLSEELKIL